MLKLFSVILAGFKCLRNKLEKSLKWLGFIFFVSEYISLINGGKSLWSGLQRGLTEQIYNVITDFLLNITHYKSFFFSPKNMQIWDFGTEQLFIRMSQSSMIYLGVWIIQIRDNLRFPSTVLEILSISHNQ